MAGDNETADELSRRCRAELERSVVSVTKNKVPIVNGSVSIDDRIVTVQNDRRITTSRGDFVRNGSRWLVIGPARDGSLYVASLNQGQGDLASRVLREHVALGYALTVHKAQGKTDERAALLVDKQMSAAQLYVGMRRGREENRAFVVCSEDDPDERGERPSKDAYDVLGAVMRRDDGSESAHDVMRRNLTQSEVRDRDVPQRQGRRRLRLRARKRSDLALTRQARSG